MIFPLVKIRFRTLHFAVIASAIAALLVFWMPTQTLETQREEYFDWLTQIIPPPRSDKVVVVDIDKAALATRTNQSWQRSDTARLANKIAANKPAAMAFDLVFSEECQADSSVNVSLQRAMASAPTVLGFLISDGTLPPPNKKVPLVYAKDARVPALWFIDGIEKSCDQFETAAQSSAASFLVGDEDARVRRIQAFTIYQNVAFPALALEATRFIGASSSTTILSGNPLALRMPGRTLNLAEDGSIRFSASDKSVIDGRTISAAKILDDDYDPKQLADKIVFIGSSLPNLGGLRSTASLPLEPSVQIHADLATNLITGFIPTRMPDFVRFEAIYVFLAGLCLSISASRQRPRGIAFFGLGIILFSVLLTIIAFKVTGYLFDAVSMSLALFALLVFTSFIQFAHVRRLESVARQRFGQYLPKSIVARYLDNPDMVRMEGEEREVTALFTDIESFSALAQNVGPRELIRMLDIYFAEVTRLIAESGGMVDKIVGDAVHALFNAPEDLDGHVNKAITCAEKILALTEQLRLRPDFAESGFGRTRIGIETGTVVFGEVGSGGKLDFTAHGHAINLASRLQEANKDLGTSICIGPAAAVAAGVPLKSLGTHSIRSSGNIELFTV